MDKEAIIRLERVFLEDLKGGSLREITLSIYSGEIYVLTGPTEADKVTFLNLCLGLIKPQEGEILVGGYDFKRATYHQLIDYRRKLQISYMAYPPALISNKSILSNLLLPLEYHFPKGNHLKRTKELLALLGLSKYEDKLPFELSLEEKRLVELARALVSQPQIIFYRQPLENFDSFLQQKIVKIIKQYSEEMSCTSIIVANHWLPFIPIAHRFGILDQGKLIYCGSPEELYASDEPPVQQFINIQKTIS
ncbi:ATP-binding cassette domain-containing protein [bacterium]|nr:ATP-binding cassette domain-containing protein [bacterium]